MLNRWNRTSIRYTRWQRVLLAVFSLVVFIYSILLITRSLDLLRDSVRPLMMYLIHSPGSALTIGWLGASVLLNGSAVAALSLSLFDAGLLSTPELYLMLCGSRLGATTFILVLGWFEYLRGNKASLRESSLTGVLNVLVTFSLYIPASLLGVLLLDRYSLGFLEITVPRPLTGFLEALFGPIVGYTLARVGRWGGMFLGLIVLYASLELFEEAVEGLQMEQMRRLVDSVIENPWISFLMGSLLTFLAASVSITIGIIVPLYNRDIINRRHVIPYMMGANWTTMADTLLASVVIENPLAMKSVLLLGIVVGSTALVFLSLGSAYRGFVDRLTDRITESGPWFWSVIAGPWLLLVLLWFLV